MFLSKRKEQKKQANIFIEIDLDRRRGKRYPEYNFMDLVNDQKRKTNTYCEEEDSKYVDPEAAEIVKRLEAKYGNKKSKKKKFQIDDFVDKGQGYDLSDPFVDDTDIYDEYLPSTMSTSKGGFYINRGKLDFKNTHNEEDSSDDEKRRAPTIPTERSIQQRAPVIPIDRNSHQRAPAIPNERNIHHRAPAIPTEKNNQQRHERAPAIPIIERNTQQRVPAFCNKNQHRSNNQQRAPAIPIERSNHQRHEHKRAPAIPNLGRTHATSNITKEKSPANRGK